jgi:hypothetical protein
MEIGGVLKPDTGSDLLRDLVGADSSALRRPLPGGSESLRIRLAPNPTAPQRARRAIATLGDQLSPRAVADLRTVVNELVTICLSNPTEAPIEVRVEMRDGNVRGEVGRPEDPSVELRGDGNALRIIGALVDEWGVDPDRAIAWFCMSTRG